MKEYLNPSELFDSRQYGFSQGVAGRGGKWVHLSGQVGWNNQEQMPAENSLYSQTCQALRNMEIVMRAAGGQLRDVVTMRIYILASVIVEGDEDIQRALKTFFKPDALPATTWIGVPCLANPAFLIEIEAQGVIE